jgi:hypothetical protein
MIQPLISVESVRTDLAWESRFGNSRPKLAAA